MNKQKMTQITQRIGLASATIGASLLALASTAHAQVTYSATDANTAASTVVAGVLTFFWANVTPVLEIAAAIGIVLTVVMFIMRKVGGKKRLR